MIWFMPREKQTDQRPTPGTKVRLERVVWPERRGLPAVVVDTDGAEGVYPVHGLGRSEVLVYIERDPLGQGEPHKLANGRPWSCAVHLPDIDIEAPGDGT